MRQACARFEQYLKRRFGQSSTPKHYISDLNIFLRTVGQKAAEEVTVEDIVGYLQSMNSMIFSFSGHPFEIP